MEMDYKEKYEKALERARKLNADNMLSDEATEEIFPELNEDERIRLFICDLITRIFWGITWDFSKKDCLAYLEKQKEPRDYRKLYKGVSQSEWFKENYEGKSLGEEKKSVDGKELLYVSSKSYNIGYRDGKMAAESKQEWSKDDEKKLELVTDFVFEFYPDPVMKYKLKAWLKSLRNRPKASDTWKPSEEQMDALKSKLPIIKGTGTATDIYLVQLYEHLREL